MHIHGIVQTYRGRNVATDPPAEGLRCIYDKEGRGPGRFSITPSEGLRISVQEANQWSFQLPPDLIGGRTLSDDMPDLCEGCTSEKSCCKTLNGLWTTEDEFRSVFEGHEDKFMVKRSNNIVFLYVKDNRPCPFWKGRCMIYQSRPLDCRLFPYKMTNIIQFGSRIKITFNNMANCPKRNDLMSGEEAAALVLEFGKMAYGQDTNIVVQNERTAVLRTMTVLESYLSRPRLVVGGE